VLSKIYVENGDADRVKALLTQSGLNTASLMFVELWDLELSVSPDRLPDGAVGESYSAALVVAGGTSPYSWQVRTNDVNATFGYTERRTASTFAASSGTAQSWRSDDNCWEYTLPFAFPFYGKAYSKAYVNSNGTLAFDASFSACNESLSELKKHVMIAAMWDDLKTSASSSDNVYVTKTDDSVTFRWKGTYYSGGTAVNFSVTLSSDGSIRLAYGSGNASGGLVGISAGDGVDFLVCSCSQSGSLANAQDVVIEPVQTGVHYGLPQGLTLSASGVVSGTPTEASSNLVDVIVTDAQGKKNHKEVVLVIRDDPVSVVTHAVNFDLGEHGTRTGGGALSQDVTYGAYAVAPTVAAEAGWRFVGWSPSVTEPITAATTFVAQYERIYHDVVVRTGDGVTTNRVAWGTSLTFEAPTNIVDELCRTQLVCLGSSYTAPTVTNRFAVTVTNDLTVAWDVWQTNYWFEAVAGAHGTVSCEAREAGGGGRGATALPGWVVSGDVVTVTATPEAHYHLAGWTGETSGCVESGLTLTVPMTAARAVAAAFAIDTFAVTFDLGAHGSRVGGGALSQVVDYGAAAEEPVVDEADGWAFEGWDADFAVVTNDLTVHAQYAQLPPPELSLELQQTSVAENDARGVKVILHRSGVTKRALTVTLTADADQLTFPASVEIPAGNASAVLTVVPKDNATVEGTRKVAIVASAAGAADGRCELEIVDDEVPSLTLTFSSETLTEGGAHLVVTVTRQLVTDEPLTVNLTGLTASRCTCPSSVTIPANEASVTFEIVATDDDVARIVEEMTLRASATGYVSATHAFSVEDDDIPSVRLELYPEEVSEGAGALAAYATLTRTDTNQITQSVTVNLTVSEANQLIVPATVTIPAYTMGVRFAVGTVDNADDDGDREVTINGSIKIASCGCSWQPTGSDALAAVVRINDNDGPAFALRAEPSTMKEGLAEAGWLVLSHNSSTDKDVTVVLSYDVENEISLPEQVVIPAGQREIRLPVRTIDDGVEDGGKLVSVYAEDADGVFATGSTWIQVSDQNLPDVQAVAVTPSAASVIAKKTMTVSFAVTNSGFNVCAKGLPYAIHLVQGTLTSVSSATLVKRGTVTAELPVGASCLVAAELTAPDVPGDYRIAVVLDPDGLFSELDKANNTGWSSSFAVGAAYTATVQVAEKTYLPGTNMVLSGQATLPDGTTPAANVSVEVYVLRDGMRRTLRVRTDSSGAFSTVFTPSAGEAGHYTVGACYPGVGSTVEQDAFDILGMELTSKDAVTHDLAIGDSITFTVGLKNRSKMPLTGMQVTVGEVPAAWEVECAVPETLGADGRANVSIALRAVGLSAHQDWDQLAFCVTSAEGVELSFAVYCHSQSQKAQLRAGPTSIDTTMAVGSRREISLTILNDGKGDSGEVRVALPEAAWLRLVTPSVIDNLAPGASAVITLEVAPDAAHNLALNSPLTNGKVAVNCANGNGCAIPLTFTPVSESTGGVRVDVVDNNTYMLESAPHLAGATVRVTNPYTGAIVAEGQSGTDGVWSADNIPEGTYQLTVTAPHHETYADELVIEPARTQKLTPFLQYQLVSATWDVVKTEIEDEYEIKMVLDFETSVPAPIVKTTAPSELPELNEGESYTFTIHLENEGVIQAEQVTLTMPEIPGYTFTLSDNDIVMPAKSSTDVTVVFSRPKQKMRLMTSSSVCRNRYHYEIRSVVSYQCGPKYQWYAYATVVCFGQKNDPDDGTPDDDTWTGPSHGSGTGGPSSRGGGSGGGGSSTGRITSRTARTHRKTSCDSNLNKLKNIFGGGGSGGGNNNANGNSGNPGSNGTPDNGNNGQVEMNSGNASVNDDNNNTTCNFFKSAWQRFKNIFNRYPSANKYLSEVPWNDKDKLASVELSSEIQSLGIFMVDVYRRDKNDRVVDNPTDPSQFVISETELHEFGARRLHKDEVESGLYLSGINGCSVDKFGSIRKGGFKAALYETQTAIIVAFAGTDMADGKPVLDDGLTDLANGLSLPTSQYATAARLVRNVRENSPGTDIVVVGHSLGGGLAEYALLKNNYGRPEKVSAVTYNSAGISRSSIPTNISNSDLSKISAAIVNYRALDDYISVIGSHCGAIKNMANSTGHGHDARFIYDRNSARGVKTDARTNAMRKKLLKCVGDFSLFLDFTAGAAGHLLVDVEKDVKCANRSLSSVNAKQESERLGVSIGNLKKITDLMTKRFEAIYSALKGDSFGADKYKEISSGSDDDLHPCTWQLVTADAIVNMCIDILKNADESSGYLHSDSLLESCKPISIGEDDFAQFIDNLNLKVEADVKNAVLCTNLKMSSAHGLLSTDDNDGESLLDALDAIDEEIASIENEIAEQGYTSLGEAWEDALTTIRQAIDANSQAVCASVTIQLSQTMAMTREAFNGTLTLYNGHESVPLQDLKMEVSILDADGNECRDLFVNNNLGTTGDMSQGWILDGGLSVAPNGTGSAVIQFIPSRNAAVDGDKLYRFGGTVTYTDPFSGEKATIKLVPVPLTVSPSPYLKLDYFIQRDVYADDPFTPDVVEASLPAEIAVLVRNEGTGNARNVTISSVQPSVVKNEKGLAVDFSLKDYSLDATALNGATAHLGLNDVVIGDVAGGASAVAQWWLTSSIQGHFVNMSATVTPLNSWNTPDTTLVNPDVGVHKLIRSLSVGADGRPSFLVSERSDLYGTPDMLYSPDGDVVSVRNDAAVALSGMLEGENPVLTMSVTAKALGWNYVMQAVQGLSRYTVESVVRSDGGNVPLRNVWTTDRVYRDAKDPLWEDRLHVADELPVGTVAYEIRLKAKPTDVPEVLSFEGVTAGALENTVRDAVTVVFSKPVNPSTFTPLDVSLVCQGSRVDDLSGLSIAAADGTGTRYVLSGLSALCGTPGRYELTVQCAGIADAEGTLGTSGKSVAWTYRTGAIGKPWFSQEVTLNGTRFYLTFPENVDPASVTVDRLALTRNGTAVDLPATVTLTRLSGNEFVIGGLDAVLREDGQYELTFGDATLIWGVDKTPPAPATDVRIVPDLGVSDSDFVTCTRTLRLSGTLAETNLAVDVLLEVAGTDAELMTSATVGGTAFVADLVLPADGRQTIIVRTTDSAGNASELPVSVYVDALPLEIVLSGAPVDLAVPASTVTVSFSEAVVTDDVTLVRFALTRDGEAVALDGVSLEELDGRTYVLLGLETLTSDDGAYVLAFDGRGVRKLSSGLAADSTTALSWTYKNPDVTSPELVSVTFDGEAPQTQYDTGFSTVSITFSEAVNVPELIANGLIERAVRIDLLSGGVVTGSLQMVAAPTWNVDANVLTVTVDGARLPFGSARLVFDAGLLADLSGNALSVESLPTTEGLPSFALQQNLLAQANAYAMPTWYDWDGDGLADLLVGEKTAAGTGKVRVYRNVGTVGNPVFASSEFMQVNGIELEVAASGCQGVHVCFADLNRDGRDDLIVGFADGRVEMHPGTVQRGQYGAVVTLRTGAEAGYASARAVSCPYDLDSDGTPELVVGGQDGKFRVLKYNVANGTCATSWLMSEKGTPLVVSADAGRSAPVLADINCDGFVDVLSGDTKGNVWLFLGRGDFWYAEPICVLSNDDASVDRSRLGLGDVNGDGVPDILMGRSNGGVSLLLGSGTPSPQFTFERKGYEVLIRPTLSETVPSAGQFMLAYDTVVTAEVVRAVITSGATQYVCKGWTAPASEPNGGVGASAVFRVRQNTVLDWLWETNVLTIAEAVNATNWTWTTGGSADWLPEWSAEAPDGRHRVRNAEMGHNASMWMETTVSGAGTVSFVWKSSTEANYDLFQLFVDGEQRGAISGETPWTTNIVQVLGGGTHTLRWTYKKSRSRVGGSDTVWIDGVSWTPDVPPSLAEALGAEFVWRTSGDGVWTGERRASLLDEHTDWASIQGVDHDQSATLSTVVFGSGIISFDWAASTEEGYDYLWFNVDGSSVTSLTGEKSWRAFATRIVGDGRHTLEWVYRKDYMDDEALAGDNIGFVDNVRWSPDSPASQETKTTGVAMPFSVIREQYGSYWQAADGDYEAAATATGKNGYRIWESYVAGLEPEDEKSKFTSKITFVDGKPVITWEPDLNDDGKRSVRSYTTYGCENIGGKWHDMSTVPEADKPNYRFFKVTVEMP